MAERTSDRNNRDYQAYIGQFAALRSELETYPKRRFGLSAEEAQDVVIESLLRACKAAGCKDIDAVLPVEMSPEELRAGRALGYTLTRTAALDFIRVQRRFVDNEEPGTQAEPVRNPGVVRAILRQIEERLDEFYSGLHLTGTEARFLRAIEDESGAPRQSFGCFIFSATYLQNTCAAEEHTAATLRVCVKLAITPNYVNVLSKRVKTKWVSSLHKVAGGLQ